MTWCQRHNSLLPLACPVQLEQNRQAGSPLKVVTAGPVLCAPEGMVINSCIFTRRYRQAEWFWTRSPPTTLTNTHIEVIRVKYLLWLILGLSAQLATHGIRK